MVYIERILFTIYTQDTEKEIYKTTMRYKRLCSAHKMSGRNTFMQANYCLVKELACWSLDYGPKRFNHEMLYR